MKFNIKGDILALYAATTGSFSTDTIVATTSLTPAHILPKVEVIDPTTNKPKSLGNLDVLSATAIETASFNNDSHVVKYRVVVAAHDTPSQTREMVLPITFKKSINEAYLDTIDAASVKLIDGYSYGPLRSSTLSAQDMGQLALLDKTLITAGEVGIVGNIDLTKYNGDSTSIEAVFTLTKGAASRQVTKTLTFPKSQNQMDIDSLIASNFSVATSLQSQTAPSDGSSTDTSKFNAVSMVGSETQGVVLVSASTHMESDDSTKGTISLIIGKGNARRTMNFDATYGHSRN